MTLIQHFQRAFAWIVWCGGSINNQPGDTICAECNGPIFPWALPHELKTATEQQDRAVWEDSTPTRGVPWRSDR